MSNFHDNKGDTTSLEYVNIDNNSLDYINIDNKSESEDNDFKQYMNKYLEMQDLL